MADDAPNTDFLIGAQMVVKQARASIRSSTIWTTGVPKLHLLCKAALIRQTEALEAAIFLAEAGKGHAALPFVRPACEEFLWIKYLVEMQRADSELLIDHLVAEQVLHVLVAQEAFAGENTTISLGLGGKRANFQAVVDQASDARTKLGQRLRWDKRTVREARLPTTRFVAKQVAELATYDFIYAGSCRHVHFNAAELLRRVWGRDLVYEVGSASFGRYFTDFSLMWMSRFLVRLFLQAESILPGTLSRFAEDRNWTEALPRGLVPIVTAEEMSVSRKGATLRGSR